MRDINLINLTPHAVTIMTEFESMDDAVTIPPSGTVARCTQESEEVDTVKIAGLNVPIIRTVFGDVVGLPDPADGTLFVVSRIVAEAARDRKDLVVPAETVRDEAGDIIGCLALAHV